MKSILHLKDDTEYQIPLREAEEDDKRTDRVKVDVAATNPEVKAEKETEAEKEVKPEEADNKEKANDEEKATATQSQDDIDVTEVYEEDPDETQKPEQPGTEESNSDTTTESVPPADTAKAALDEMKKLASQEGVIHPSLFISNFSKILGLMERAMQLQVKESGSATEESGSVTKEAPKSTEQVEAPEQAEVPAEGK